MSLFFYLAVVVFLFWLSWPRQKHKNQKPIGASEPAHLFREEALQGDDKDHFESDFVAALFLLSQIVPVDASDLPHATPASVAISPAELESLMLNCNAIIARLLAQQNSVLTEVVPGAAEMEEARLAVKENAVRDLEELLRATSAEKKVGEAAEGLVFEAPVARKAIEAWRHARLTRVRTFARQAVALIETRRALIQVLELRATRRQKMQPTDGLAIEVAILRAYAELLGKVHEEYLAAARVGQKADLAVRLAMSKALGK